MIDYFLVKLRINKFIYLSLMFILVNMNVFAGVGSSQSSLTGNQLDTNTATSNATVWVGGCTGTLIKPDMIVTAGHCINRARASSFYTSNVWYPVSNLVNTRWNDIRFGADKNAPILRATATHFAILNGLDIGLFLLSAPVNRRIAIPVPVVLDTRGINWSRQRFKQAGWGLTSASGITQPRFRRMASATFSQWPCNTNGGVRDAMFCATGQTVLSGDSGGPLYWIDRNGRPRLVGVAQGNFRNGGRYTPTFITAGAIDRVAGRNISLPDNVRFLSWNLKNSRCSLIKYSERILLSDFARLVRWFSPRRNDNLLTTEATWQGCRGDIRSPGYQFSKVEGKIFHPNNRSRPRDTIPLYKWYSPSRSDSWATTLHADVGARRGDLSPGYRHVSLLGYIYPPNHRPIRDNMVPLYRWYSNGRKDNFTTTLHSSVAERRGRLEPGYRFTRLEGYILRE